MNISDQEFAERQQKFLNEQGLNTGDGFFGKWAWHVHTKRKFRDMLRSEGYYILPEEDVSDEALFGEVI